MVFQSLLKIADSLLVDLENAIPFFLVSKRPLGLDRFNALSNLLDQFSGNRWYEDRLSCHFNVNRTGVSKRWMAQGILRLTTGYPQR